MVSANKGSGISSTEAGKDGVMSEVSTPVPDYKTLLGVKILRLAELNRLSVEVGSKVLVFEAKVVTHYNATVSSESMEWRFALPDADMLLALYTHGIYKMVGVGLVLRETDVFGTYLVAVQDDLQTEFSEAIPF